MKPGHVVDFRLFGRVPIRKPVARNGGEASPGPMPRTEQQKARPGQKWQQLRRVEGASRRMRERLVARESEEARALRAESGSRLQTCGAGVV